MRSIVICFVLFLSHLRAQQALELKEIMKGQDFTGYWPSSPQWNLDGSAIYFRWNKDAKEESEPYLYRLKSAELKEVSEAAFKEMIPFDPQQKEFSNQLTLVQQSLVLTDRKSMKSTLLLQTDHFISDVYRLSENEASLRMDGDFYRISFNASGMFQMVQLTKYVEPKKGEKRDSTLLEMQQRSLFQFLRDQEPESIRPNRSSFETVKETPLPAAFSAISGRFLSLQHQVVLLREDELPEEKQTTYTAFITSDGYLKSKNARAKVSANEPNQRMYLHGLVKDTLIPLDFSKLSDIRAKASYLDTNGGKVYKQDRPVFLHDPIYAKTKPLALIDVRAADNKDRWIVVVDLIHGKVTEIERQHDEAWIGGPGISEWNMEKGTLGFVENDEVVYFQSEENGFSQLYEINLSSKRKGLVYPGGVNFEMHSVSLSADGTKYFVVHNGDNPRCLQGAWLHRIHKKMSPVISNAYAGFKDLVLSPNELNFAYLFSSATSPWELYLKEGNNAPQKITKSTTTSFDQYPWISPSYITFPGNDGKEVYARQYTPSPEVKNGATILFVHGAGYLQNAHAWWSHYYREYMFHNLLVSRGYTVLDIDYRASAGYGRDYRTAIYRHMGGRDVQDFLDAKKYLATLNLDTNRVGIYGGSYGGFVTLMSLFQHPDAFACGAALRSVTDWAHYNHEYTSNILNYPETDAEAYRKSSPIYFAEGLKKPLLMLHGMVDDNVQFQDIVRLQQRLIELGKIDWELAAYPVEEHGFKEAYSWFDEYRRILNLFDKHLAKP